MCGAKIGIVVARGYRRNETSQAAGGRHPCETFRGACFGQARLRTTPGRRLQIAVESFPSANCDSWIDWSTLCGRVYLGLAEHRGILA